MFVSILDHVDEFHTVEDCRLHRILWGLETPDKAFRTFSEELEWQLPAIALGLNSKFRAELDAILLAVLKEFIRRVLIENSQDWGVGMERRQLDFRVDFLACGIAAYATEHCGDKPFDTALFTEQMNAMLEPLRH